MRDRVVNRVYGCVSRKMRSTRDQSWAGRRASCKAVDEDALLERRRAQFWTTGSTIHVYWSCAFLNAAVRLPCRLHVFGASACQAVLTSAVSGGDVTDPRSSSPSDESLVQSNLATVSSEKPFATSCSASSAEERALALAATFTVDPNPRRRARDIFPRFDDNARVLRDAYRILADDVRTGQFVTAAAEWLLDNFHLVASEIRDIHQHLPGTYYRQLPTLASREQAGHTRIYAMAVELVRHSDSRIDRQQLAMFVKSYQRVAPLTIGELWAWPSMLKLALIENLRRLAVRR